MFCIVAYIGRHLSSEIVCFECVVPRYSLADAVIGCLKVSKMIYLAVPSQIYISSVPFVCALLLLGLRACGG